ncbi:Testis anion transporter 1, partial [Varanus komodoensis]
DQYDEMDLNVNVDNERQPLRVTYNINRKVYNEEEFQKDHDQKLYSQPSKEPDSSPPTARRIQCRRTRFSCSRFRKLIVKMFPILNWLCSYRVTEWILGDIHAGINVGMIQIFQEHIMRKAGLDESPDGIKIAGRNINNLRYADDTTLMAESEEELKSLLMRVKEESAKVGLKLNIKKTKIMTSIPITSWQIDGKEMEVVTDFIFLSSRITADRDCSQEIKRHLLLGRKAMANLDSILKNRDITLLTKVHIVKAMVFSVAMYGSESWTIRKAERRRIEAFELWCWRRLLRVPWTARRSNRSVLEEINPDCFLEGQILKMQLKYFGHLMRRKDSLEKSLMLGTIDGKRRGRQRMKWIDGVTEAVGVSLSGLQGMVEDRKAWRNVVHGTIRNILNWITTAIYQQFLLCILLFFNICHIWNFSACVH